MARWFSGFGASRLGQEISSVRLSIHNWVSTIKLFTTVINNVAT
jgi:hypothetical protein